MPVSPSSTDPASLESGVYLRHLHPDIGLPSDGNAAGGAANYLLSSHSGVAPRPNLDPGDGVPASPPDSRTSGLYVLGPATPVPPSREILTSEESAILPAPRIESKSTAARSSGPKSPAPRSLQRDTATLRAVPSVPLRPLPPPTEGDSRLSMILWKLYAVGVTAILLFLWLQSLVVSWIAGTGR